MSTKRLFGYFLSNIVFFLPRKLVFGNWFFAVNVRIIIMYLLYFDYWNYPKTTLSLSLSLSVSSRMCCEIMTSLWYHNTFFSPQTVGISIRSAIKELCSEASTIFLFQPFNHLTISFRKFGYYQVGSLRGQY